MSAAIAEPTTLTTEAEEPTLVLVENTEATSEAPSIEEPQPTPEPGPLLPPGYVSQVTAGRMVHFVMWNRNGEKVHRPAVVVKVQDRELGLVSLRVFTDADDTAFSAGLPYYADVAPDPDGEAIGTWHWIERAG